MRVVLERVSRCRLIDRDFGDFDICGGFGPKNRLWGFGPAFRIRFRGVPGGSGAVGDTTWQHPKDAIVVAENVPRMGHELIPAAGRRCNRGVCSSVQLFVAVSS